MKALFGKGETVGADCAESAEMDNMNAMSAGIDGTLRHSDPHMHPV
jgi:hypothetical protein